MPQTFCLIASVFWRRLDARPVTPVFCKGLSWSICLLTKESALATSHNKPLSGKAWGIFRHRSSSRYQSSGFSAGTISLRLAFSKRHVDKSCTECRPMRASTAFNTVVLELASTHGKERSVASACRALAAISVFHVRTCTLRSASPCHGGMRCTLDNSSAYAGTRCTARNAS